MTDPGHTTHCTLGSPHPRTGDVPVYGPDGSDGPTLGVVVATNPRAAADARLWAGAWRLAEQRDRLTAAVLRFMRCNELLARDVAQLSDRRPPTCSSMDQVAAAWRDVTDCVAEIVREDRHVDPV